GACLCWGEWERACRSSGSGGEGIRNRGEGGVESGEKNGLNSTRLNWEGRDRVHVWDIYTIALWLSKDYHGESLSLESLRTAQNWPPM
nr:hypothetical protein [Tanacetum cinerariifolium]